MKHVSQLILATFAACSIASCADASGTVDSIDHDAPVESIHGITAADHGMELVLPIPNGSVQHVTRGYDIASHATYGPEIWDDRYALDFSGSGCSSFGTPVVAVADGIVNVDRARFDTDSMRRSYGDAHVVIDHGNGCYSHYGHLDSREVTHGQRVAQGQIVGRQGNKGAVTGTACPSRPGTHLHFKMFCHGEAIVPEPMSGFVGFRSGQTYGTEEHLRFPVGTLVRLPDAPEIYLVTGEKSLLHVPDWATFVGRRFFYDADLPDQRVATVSARALACHAIASGMEPGPPARLVPCGDGDYVVFTQGMTVLRRRVPFARSDARYRPLVASWGFRTSERLEQSDIACSSATPTGSPLTMRPGTVIEEASDDDFWVITTDTYRADDARDAHPRTHALRLRRRTEDGTPFLPLLYGTYGVVLQVPDGTVRDFVTDGIRDGDAGFTRAISRMCGYGPDASGGGTSLPPETPEPIPVPPQQPPPPDPEYPSCVPEHPALPGESPPSQQPAPPVSPVPLPAPPQPPQPPEQPGVPADGSIRCAYGDASTLVVHIEGPVTRLLVGDAPHEPLDIRYGSNTDGWTPPFAAHKARAAWNGSSRHVLTLPRNVNGFNLYLYSTDGGAWFDLVDADRDGDRWTVTGVCRLDGTLIRH